MNWSNQVAYMQVVRTVWNMERAAQILSFLRDLESHYRDIRCSSEPQAAITNSSINLLSCNVSSLDSM
jgi:hypothetical protein